MPTTIYVLKLEDEKYYVGKTSNISNRFTQHIDGSGAAWTKKYKPIEMIASYDNCDNFDEDKYTLMMMEKYGIENVRGGTFCEVVLSEAHTQFLTQMLNSASDTCFVCGKRDHFAKDCPINERNNCYTCGKKGHIAKFCLEGRNYSNNRDPKNMICYRCTNIGHIARDCPNSSHINVKSNPDEMTVEMFDIRFKNNQHTLIEAQIGNNEDTNTEKDTNPKPIENLNTGTYHGPGYNIRNTCSKYGTYGHFARECPNTNITPNVPNVPNILPRRDVRDTCSRCGAYGHFARECNNTNNTQVNTSISNTYIPSRDIRDTCSRCGTYGHFARECPNKNTNGTNGSVGGCFKCGKQGHIAKKCPNA